VTRSWPPTPPRPAGERDPPGPGPASLALAAFFACGAQAGVQRNIVMLHADRLAYMRESLAVDHPVRAIVVVLPQRNACPHEPCNDWMGFLVADKNHIRARNGYLYALATVDGEATPLPVLFLTYKDAQSAALPEGAAVVDWDRYVSTRPGSHYTAEPATQSVARTVAAASPVEVAERPETLPTSPRSGSRQLWAQPERWRGRALRSRWSWAASVARWSGWFEPPGSVGRGRAFAPGGPASSAEWPGADR
jgi:hypothetical protein